MPRGGEVRALLGVGGSRRIGPGEEEREGQADSSQCRGAGTGARTETRSARARTTPDRVEGVRWGARCGKPAEEETERRSNGAGARDGPAAFNNSFLIFLALF